MHPGDTQGSHVTKCALRNKNVWLMGGDLNGFRDITHFMK